MHIIRQDIMYIGEKQDNQQGCIIHYLSHSHRQTVEDKACVSWVVVPVYQDVRVANTYIGIASIAEPPKL